MSDSIEILEATLAGSEKAVRDRDEEITLLKTTIKGFEAALELANEKVTNRTREIRELSDLRDSNNSDNRQLLEERDREIAELRSQLDAAEKLLELSTKDSLELRSQNKNTNEALNNIAFQLGFQSFDNEQVAIAIEGLQDRLACLSTLTARLESEKSQIVSQVLTLESITQDRDRKIEILEDNLNRARSEHLEQLRAIVQMLQPLIGRPYNSTENKDGKIYVHVNHANDFTHAEKNAAIKLIQKVLYSNIKKLDPWLKSSPYDDDF